MTNDFNLVNQKIWDKLYEEGKSNLSFPNENLVRFIHYLYPDKKEIPGSKVLDYGFGSGNNMKFLIDMGFDLYGYEISDHAKAMTLKKLPDSFDQERLVIRQGEMSLPFDAEFFDFVLAWGVLNYNTYETLITSLDKLKKVLKKDGKFLLTLGRPNDIAALNSTPTGKYERVINSSVATQQNATVVVLPTEAEIKSTFSMFKSVQVGYFESSFMGIVNAHWTIYCEK